MDVTENAEVGCPVPAHFFHIAQRLRPDACGVCVQITVAPMTDRNNSVKQPLARLSRAALIRKHKDESP